MSIEVLAEGVRCNLDCQYCYQDAIRRTGATVRHDKKLLLDAVAGITDPWTLFGGEPLLLPLGDLEDLLRVGFETVGVTNIQTNGSLITPRHIELFKRYHTHVGISVDGPGALNDARWAGTLEATRKMTDRTHTAVAMLVEAAREVGRPNLIPSFIVQLHRLNLADDRWPRLVEWFEYLDNCGVSSAQYHLLDLDNEADDLYVPTDLITTRLLDLWKRQSDFATLRFRDFLDVTAAQRGHTAGTCVWHACDPWNTQAVEGLNGDGTPTQCGRAGSNDGVDWIPALAGLNGVGTESVSRASGFVGARFHERQLSLYVTPQEHGGCKDCRFWLMCQGHCPGSGIPTAKDPQGDWRLRSVYCPVFKSLFEEAEHRVVAIGEQPVSLWPDRENYEHMYYEMLANGQEAMLGNIASYRSGTLPDSMDINGHGDHTDVAGIR